MLKPFVAIVCLNTIITNNKAAKCNRPHIICICIGFQHCCTMKIINVIYAACSSSPTESGPPDGHWSAGERRGKVETR